MHINLSNETQRKAQLSERAGEMQASPIRRLVPLADAAKKRGTKVYHLNIGQPDIVTPHEIMEAVHTFEEKVLAYGPSQGLLPLREEIMKYFAKYQINITPDEVIITTGGSEAIMFALMAIGDAGDEVLIPEPFYTNYNGFATMSLMKLVPVPTHVENGYGMPTRAEFEKRITPRTRAIMYCSPNNPTGAIFSRKDVEMVVELAIEKNLWILADEVYREFTYDGGHHTSILSFPEVAHRSIMLDSISKRFSACGARIGCMVSKSKRVMDAALKFGQARLCPPTIEQLGAIAGYQTIDRFLDQMIGEYQHRRDIVCEELAHIPGAIFTKPAGAFYIMPKLPVDNADKFAQWLLTDFVHDGATAMVAPGDGFYASPNHGKHEVRIAYVLKEADLRQAMKTLVKAVEAYNKL
jgi:aspartate aminotransferase